MVTSSTKLLVLFPANMIEMQMSEEGRGLNRLPYPLSVANRTYSCYQLQGNVQCQILSSTILIQLQEETMMHRSYSNNPEQSQ